MGPYLQNLHSWLLYLIVIVLSAALCMSTIPRIIFISKKKRLFDQPDSDRKIHKEVIPNLGGVGIFLGFFVIASLMINPAEFTGWNYLIAASLILFLTGIKDDLINVNPSKKFLAQITASLIIAYLGDLRLHHLHGFLGIQEMPYGMSLALTVLGCTFVSNAFNLIDGVDGLAGSIAVIACFFLGLAFATTHNYSPAVISFALMGSILGFLRYNYAPARIFMGDSGSLVIGFVIAVLAILLTEKVKHFEGNSLFHSPKAVLLAALSLFFIPVFDTFRVFLSRIMHGRSPFAADRNHLHHYLLDLGFSHFKTVMIMSASAVIIILLAFVIQDLPLNLCISMIILGAFILVALLLAVRRARIQESDPGSVRPKSKWIL